MEEQDPHPEHSRGRETFLAVLLTLLVGGGFVLYMSLVTFGLFGWVILISVAMSLFGVLHYVLWGRSFMRSMAAERREMERQEELEKARTTKPAWERRF